MAGVDYERSVFINCPFDEQYEPILQAMLFTVLYLGFVVRISFERNNSAQNRLNGIVELIRASKYSIHDLSRAQSKKKGEYFRLNMPFELGIDYGCRQFDSECESKEFLILEEKSYRYQATLSDLAGCDIETHKGDYQEAMKKVRNWLVQEAGAPKVGPTLIESQYGVFQQWYWESQLKAGSSEDDIRGYPTREIFDHMKTWFIQGMPVAP